MSQARRMGVACLFGLLSWVSLGEVGPAPLRALAGIREDAVIDVISKMRDQEHARQLAQAVDLHAAYLASSSSQQQTLISLSLGVNYLESNPRLALQYLSSAELSCQESDPLLPMVRFYLADAKYRAGAYGDAMQLTKGLLHQDFGDYWMKQVHSLLIESLYAAGDHEQLITEFKEFSQRFSFSRRQEVLARMASEAFETRGDHAAAMALNEELARNYPATAESRWAFQKLEDATCLPPDKGGYIFSERLLSHLSQNVVLNTGLEQFLVAAVDRPVIDATGRVHRMDAAEKTEFFIHNHLFKQALATTEALYNQEQAKAKVNLDTLPKLVYELGRIHLRLFEPGKSEALLQDFLANYSHHPLVARVRELLGDAQRYGGKPLLAAASYAKALKSRPTPILRWLYFWSLYRGKDYAGALDLVEKPGFVQPREGDEPYVVSYWHARVLEKLNRVAEAETIYSDILRQNGNTFYAMMIATAHPELTRRGGSSQLGLANQGFIGPPSPAATPANATASPGLLRTERDLPVISLAARALPATGEQVGDFAPATALVQGATGRADLRLIEDLLRVGLREAASAQLGRMRWTGFGQADAFASITRLCTELDDYRPSRNVRSTSFTNLKTLPRNWDDLVQLQATYADEWKVYYPLAYDRILLPIAARMHMNPFLVLSIMRAESSYNREARSGVGAQGLLQLMPYTALKIAMLLHDENFDVREITKPEVNIGYGVYYLDKLLRYYNDNPVLAAAAYNGGPVVVNQWLGTCSDCTADEFVDSIPYKETRHYVREVMRSYDLYSRLYTGKAALSHISAMPRELPEGDDIF